MNPTPRRALTVDDPVGGREPCHVAHPSSDHETATHLRHIAVQDIRPNPDQPRKHFDEAGLIALAGSIRERGILQPIIVRPGGRGEFEIVAGERRWRAAQLAEMPSVPALIDDRADGASSLELALIENVVREDLTPIEEARTIVSLLEDLRVTTSELAKRLGRSRSDIAHTVRLLELPDQVIELINEGTLTKGHGKALLTEQDHHRRLVLARRAAADGWSVRKLEDEVGRGREESRPHSQPDADQCVAAARLQDAMTAALGCEVRTRPYRDGYQITLGHNGAEHLARVLSAQIGS